ncbi:MAG: hypothetical protein ACRDAI_02045 [Candidatus Rhabdochlamydia sp.]
MAITNNSSNQFSTGILSNNGTGIVSGRLLTAGSTKISITNPDGIAGNPTLDVVPVNISINSLGGAPLSTLNGGTGVAAPTTNTLPVAQGASAMTFLGPLTNGQVLIGATGTNPVPGVLTAGLGISITNGAGSIVISSNPSGVWNNVTTASASMNVGNGYLANNAALVTLTLPAIAVLFSTIHVAGNGAGGWIIAQNSGQTINLDATPTTTGISGSLASTNRYDCVELLCTAANTTWSVITAVGNILVT